ncbi:MAG: cell wall-binding repeat-containing protein [Coriobacteriia bacterium]
MRVLRRLVLSALITAMVVAVTPAAATMSPAAPMNGALTVSWERNWGSLGALDGQFSGPLDVEVDKWSRVYVTGVTDVADRRVQVFDSDGAFLGKTTAGWDGQPLSSPRSLACDRWGNVFVGQTGNGGLINRYQVMLANPSPSFDEASADTTIDRPEGLGVSLDGHVYATDTVLNNLQIWTPYGDGYGFWLPEGTPTTGIDVSEDGLVFTTTGTTAGVTESVVVYDDHPATLPLIWGGHGIAWGDFLSPASVAVDPVGHSFVVETDGQRVQVFGSVGQVLQVFGSFGSGDTQFSHPRGIALGPDRTLYIADSGNHRISKWNISVATQEAEVAGVNRILTAIEASKKTYPVNGSVDIVILATAYNWPDALGGAALAGAVDGPLLLTPQDHLPAEVAAEITRLAPKRVYVLGGTGAVSDAVMNAAKALTSENIATRLYGDDRYDTAIAIAAEVKAMRGAEYEGTAFICTGADFPDALSAAPIAAANSWPIYLTPPDHLPGEVAAAMLATYGGNPSNHGYIIGGTGAVSEAVADTLDAAPFGGFMRISGPDRYATSAAVADMGFNGLGMLMSRPALATGQDFPDALAGAVLQGDDCSPVLLTRGTTLSPETAAVLTEYRDMIYEIRYLGGTGVITPAVRTSARALLW